MVAEHGEPRQPGPSTGLDPDWVDIVTLPSAEKCLPFADQMLADQLSWAPTEDIWVTRTIARATARIVIPRLADFDRWRAHATDFFHRLCGPQASQARSEPRGPQQRVSGAPHPP